MADQKTSQTQQTTANPAHAAAQAFQGMSAFAAPFTSMFEDNMKRMDGMMKEMAALEQKNAEQLRTWVDESAKLMKESIDYSLKLSAEWRKLTLDAAKVAREQTTPKA
jgi:hypothetical protein